MSVPLDGGDPVELADAGTSAYRIAVDRTNVYWTNYYDGVVAKTPLDGGAMTNLVAFQDGITSCGAVAVAGSTVYFATTQNGNGNLQSVSVDGGTPVALTPVESSWADSLALGANAIYWPANAELLRTPLDGGASVSVASSVNANGIAMDAKYVYWTDQAGGTVGGEVMRVPLDGGPAVPLATQLPSPQAIAVDGAGVYWTDYPASNATGADGTVFMAPLDGGALRVLATGQWSPQVIATDGARVYWGNCGVGSDGGAVMAIAKP
jgi:hypothetical protein